MEKNNYQNQMEHPGKILAVMLKKVNMSQKELAIRTGMTEKHISTVINGSRGISLDFSKKLEYVFNDVKSGYFYNLQLEYDELKQRQEEENGITENEKHILKQLKEPIDYIIERGQSFISATMTDVEKIIGIRKFLKVSNLELIPQASNQTAFRKNKNTTVNQYVLSMWIQICEYYAGRIECKSNLNIDLLNNKLSSIRNLMNVSINEARKTLQKILLDCGIIFDIVQNFKGAPVQGFIKNENNNKILMCITIRGKRADSFWFTVFHEIGHIINGDVENIKVDTYTDINEKEIKANEFASNLVMNKNDYQMFVNAGDYTLNSIKRFSKQQNIPHYMTIGRMQKDGILEYNQYYNEIPQYIWSK